MHLKPDDQRPGRNRWLLLLAASLAACAPMATADDQPPKSLDIRLSITLFAEHPQIVTPTGLDVDSEGRVWAVESNTHFAPKPYAGHATDRILVMHDADADSRADKIVTFIDGLVHTMSVAVAPEWFLPPAAAGPAASRGNTVYAATRREILLLRDDDGDLKVDHAESIARLETKGDYPHNGLAGFALDPRGLLVFGLGENLGAPYKLIGADGTTQQGGGEGGSIYRCRPDGSRLERVATGFWNPHASAIDAFGRLFTVDNDPDSRPPCRLMHIIDGGDYGYRYRNGRKGLHPFTAWNGEILGTLPMTAGTGEAPSGILAYESRGLPPDYLGNLLVTSWGDHRIDRFRLRPRGASFQAVGEPIIQGGENFRPVGIARAPDGTLYCTDWVLKDYTLHSKGRIWRISSRERAARSTASAGNQAAALLASSRLEERRAAARGLARQAPEQGPVLHDLVLDRRRPARERLEALWGLASAEAARGFDAREMQELLAQGDAVAAAAAVLNDPRFPLDAALARKLVRPFLAERITGAAADGRDPAALTALLQACHLQPGDELPPLAAALADPFVDAVLINMMARDLSTDELARLLTPGAPTPSRVRGCALLAARRRDSFDQTLAALGLADPDPVVRRLAVQWVAEERLERLKPAVEALFSSTGVTPDLFMALLAGLRMLEGHDPAEIDKDPPARHVLPLLREAGYPLPVRVQALRLVDPKDPAIDSALIEALLNSADAPLQLEAVRTWQQEPAPRVAEILRQIAANDQNSQALRAEAVLGLAGAARVERAEGPTRKLLLNLLTDERALLATDALRALRGVPGVEQPLRAAMGPALERLSADRPRAAELADQWALAVPETSLPESAVAALSPRPASKAQWLAQLAEGLGGDAVEGRRVFFHPNGPGCHRCHVLDGRGGRVGPDLTRIGRLLNRVQLIQSILEPGAEIAPQYVNWSFETRQGKTLSGMIVHENEGKTIVGDADGRLTELATIDIVERLPQKTSVMPDNLSERMTLREFRDLLAFLASPP